MNLRLMHVLAQSVHYELKTCPFCGSEMKITLNEGGGISTQTQRVHIFVTKSNVCGGIYADWHKM